MLQSELVVRAKEASVTFREGRMTADQAQSAKELVIDATGRGLLPQAAPDAYQYAYGKWVRLEEEAFPNGEMSLMDYRDQRDAPASFLYAMQEEHPDFGRVLFVQETVVASAKPVAWDLLKSRLAKRLTQLPQVIEECGEEFCEIPLGRALPPLRPQLLAFGAAAGLVHPATGYQIAHALRMAEPLAESLSRSVHLPRRQRIAAAQDTLWPSSKRRAFKIYRWSASIMAELSPAEMTRFIDAFFASDEKSWRGFMDGTLEAREIFSLMAQVFSGSSLSLRTRLIGRAAKHGKLALQALSTQSGLSPLSPPTGRASP
jgi:lycopene beta-cyclase